MRYELLFVNYTQKLENNQVIALLLYQIVIHLKFL